MPLVCIRCIPLAHAFDSNKNSLDSQVSPKIFVLHRQFAPRSRFCRQADFLILRFARDVCARQLLNPTPAGGLFSSLFYS